MEVRAKIFHSIDFLKFSLQSEMRKQKTNWRVTVLVSDVKRVKNDPDFDKLVHVIQHGLQWFMVKNIKGESTEAHDLRLIL